MIKDIGEAFSANKDGMCSRIMIDGSVYCMQVAGVGTVDLAGVIV